MFVTQNESLFERVRTLSNHGRAPGQAKQFWPELIGYKYKLSNLQAAIGCAQLERIEELVDRKRRIFEFYADRLRHLPLTMNPEPDGSVNGYWMPTIVVDSVVEFDRDDLLDRFKADNIDGRVFFWPLSSLPMFERRPENVVSYSIYSRAINLPSYHDIDDASLERVARCVESSLGDFQ